MGGADLDTVGDFDPLMALDLLSEQSNRLSVIGQLYLRPRLGISHLLSSVTISVMTVTHMLRVFAWIATSDSCTYRFRSSPFTTRCLGLHGGGSNRKQNINVQKS